MTEQTQPTLNPEILNAILEHGLDGLPNALSLLINHAMLIERSHYLHSTPYQRHDERTGYANGFKPRSINTRLGALDLLVPQTRNASPAFFPSALERGQRSERSCAVLTAIGINAADGKRSILGTSVALSEAEVHWREFLSSLKKRGLTISGSITSDAHEGLKAALCAVFPAIPWNRCQFHLQQNAQAYVPNQEMKNTVAADIRAIFDALSLQTARDLLASTVLKYSKSAPKLASWMDENLPEAFTVFSFPEPIRKRLRTSNLSESTNKQIRRRTRVVGIFPSPESCLRLVSAVLMEISDDWETSKAYLNPIHLH